MKARIKETGEVIDVECCFYAKVGSTDPIIPNGLLEILKDDETIDWEQRRYELAKVITQGLLCAPVVEWADQNPTLDDFAYVVVRNADAIIKKLKGE